MKLKEEVKGEEATFEDVRELDVAKKAGREDSRAGSEGTAAKRARVAGKSSYISKIHAPTSSKYETMSNLEWGS